jgi:hypothetical protein
MKKPSRHTFILATSLASFGLALYFGLTAHWQRCNYVGLCAGFVTDWGKVALSLVSGSAGCVGLGAVLRKP